MNIVMSLLYENIGPYLIHSSLADTSKICYVLGILMRSRDSKMNGTYFFLLEIQKMVVWFLIISVQCAEWSDV